VILPIVVKTGNFGIIFMSKNISTGVRTRHVDTPYHFILEFIEGGFIEIEFFSSTENESDVFTKNVGQDIYEKYTAKFV
jgi:hypothetical protein